MKHDPETPHEAGSAPSATLRRLTFVWLVLVTFALGGLVVLVAGALLLGTLLSASNSVGPVTVPVVVAAGIAIGLWVLYARRRYGMVWGITLLVPVGIALFVNGQEVVQRAADDRVATARDAADAKQLLQQLREDPANYVLWQRVGDLQSRDEFDLTDASLTAYASSVREWLRQQTDSTTQLPAPVSESLKRVGDFLEQGRGTVPPEPGFPTALLAEMVTPPSAGSCYSHQYRVTTGLASAAWGYNDLAIRLWRSALREEEPTQEPYRTQDAANCHPQLERAILLALRWLRTAAAQGNARAQSDLGLLLLAGDAVPQDYAEAYYWLLLAKRSIGVRPDSLSGGMTAGPSAATLEQRALSARAHLGVQQRQDTERAVRDWKPTPTPVG